MRRFRKIKKAFVLFAVLAVAAAYGRNETGIQGTTLKVMTADAATWADTVREKISGWGAADNSINGTTDISEGSAAESVFVSDSGSSSTSASGTDTAFSLSDIPDYIGTPYAVVNNNVPYFTDADLTTEAFETYSDLDSLGRCGVAYANICIDIMPTEERGEIGSVKPTGWHTVKYNGIVDGNYLYNRCHLIGYQLAGENANEKNLITGTRYMNVDGMLPFENLVDDYVEETGNHVLYRVTPVFEGDNLVASGVLMEALSVEDNGEGVCFNVYCYNVQPGVGIDYATGESWLDGTENAAADTQDGNAEGSGTGSSNTGNGESAGEASEGTYILNTNTMKFHKPDCESVSKMNEANKREYTGSREELIEEGYEACGNCKP